MESPFLIRYDCRFYVGEKPCRFKRPCEGCPEYRPMGTRILVIKLGAIGDVLRTTPLLAALKRAYPESHVTWVVDRGSREVLEDNPSIDRLLTLDLEAVLQLSAEQFDVAINLDKVPRATGLMMQMKATRRLGFGLTPYGTLCALNRESEYALILGVSDEIKFRRNEKTYPEIVAEACGLPYRRDPYILVLRERHEAYARAFLRERGLLGKGPLVGLNTGSGPVFATKRWELDRFAALARRLSEAGAAVILMGGVDEIERNREIERLAGVPLVHSGGRHSIREFAALIRHLDVLVTGDTLALHLALAVETRVVALFGATCPQEIDLYDRGEKIVGAVPCAPCYLSLCTEHDMACMKAIEVETVFAAVTRLWEQNASSTPSL